jgi:Recombination endonuclease VII
MPEVKRRRRTRKQIEAARRRRDTSRAYHLKTRHRMTLEQYDAILEAQGGTCFMCPRTGKTRALSVDHDHEIARTQCDHPHEESCPRCWRGLLCSTCNKTLGHARDNTGFFYLGIAYLTDPPAQRWLNDRQGA